MHRRSLLIGSALILTLQGCAGDGNEGVPGADRSSESAVETRSAVSEAPILVYTVNYPLAWFAEQIGGAEVHVELPVPGDEDPAYWNPTPEQISEFQGADLILLNGAGYAGWTDRASLPPSKLINTTRAVSESYIRAEETVTHAHGPEGEHEHGTLAFTTWLDPTLAVAQASEVRDALVRARPAASARFDSAFAELEVDLVDLDARLSETAEALAGTPILGSHPVYQYLAARYDLDLRSVHFEPDELPGAAAWSELKRLQEERPATLMLWEAEPMPEVRRQLESEYGIRSIVFSPCANAPNVDDYMSIMRQNAQRLSAMTE
ncbi:MAG: metal ABC transporter substrate-binding protein [marine benthic group bacterium]|nr:metal ABC transporter substrate-binding protein [Candidatus Carthagonibacter metallireducens]